MSDTIYSSEPIITVHGRSQMATLLEVADYMQKGWVAFFPPFNVVYEKELKVGMAARRNGGAVAFMRRKENVGKEQNYYSQTSGFTGS